MPLLWMPDGTLCLPATAFFGYSTETARVGISSMKDEGYILREWLVFAAAEGRGWDRPSDDLMRSWRAAQLKHLNAAFGDAAPKARIPLTTRRIERKLEVVFTFYELLPRAFGFDGELNSYAKFVSDLDVPEPGAEITAKVIRSKDGRKSRRWVGSQPVTKGHVPRPTPSAEAVGRILRYLRTGRDAKPSQRPTKWAPTEEQLGQERNWLIGSVAATAGLRREEIASLGLDALAEALDSKMKTDWPEPPPGMHALDAVAYDPKVREGIVFGLRKLSANGLRDLRIKVRGKGRGSDGKLRQVPFPILLVEDLLEVGIWTVRRRQILHWSDRDPLYAPPATIFLSSKTKRGLEAGAVGDILKKAFSDLGETGSGHRLRAYFGMEYALRLANERMIADAGRYDTGTRDWVLSRVAQAMGHDSSHTTVKYYVQLAEMEVLLSTGGGMRGPIGRFLRQAKGSAPLISVTDLRVLGRLLELLGSAGLDPKLPITLGLLVQKFDPANAGSNT